MTGRRMVAGGGLAAVALAALLVLLPPWGAGEKEAADTPEGVLRNPDYLQHRAAVAPLRIDTVDLESPLGTHADTRAADSGDERAPPCDGCLPEPGALDVAETFLYNMREGHFGVRAELYADIAARLEAAGLPPPHETPLPKLPPGLVGADPNYALNRSYLPEVERPEETWVVWVHVGGFDTQSFINGGLLPPAAASWPPLKKERHLLVDARTGEIDTRDMWRIGTRGESLLAAKIHEQIKQKPLNMRKWRC